MTELRSVEKSAMVDLTLDDLKQMRPRVVNQNAYIDLLLSWAGCADAEIKRLEADEQRCVLAMIRAYQELNAIRARDGAPPGVDEAYFASVVDELSDVVEAMTGRRAHCHPMLYLKDKRQKKETRCPSEKP